MRDAPGKYDSALIFREDFRDAATVAGHGIVPCGNTGTVSFDNGMTNTVYEGVFVNGKDNLVDQICSKDVTFIFDVVFIAASGGLSRTLFSIKDGGTLGLVVHATTRAFYVDVAGQLTSTVTAVPLGRHRVAVARSGNSWSIYIDGALYSGPTTLSQTYVHDESQRIRIGCAGVNTRGFRSTIYSVKIFNQAFTADEVLDEYQGDTYSEITPDKALVWLPLRSQISGGTEGANIITDVGMELSGTTIWAPYVATLTKNTSNPHSGTQCLRCTTASSGVTQSGATGQAYGVLGNSYRVRGWFRGNGTVAPWVELGYGGVGRVTGTSSTAWQYFDFTDIYRSDTSIRLMFNATGAGQWVEYDDVTVCPVYPYATQNIGSYADTASLTVAGLLAEVPAQVSPQGATMKVDSKISGRIMLSGKAWTIGVAVNLTKGGNVYHRLVNIGDYTVAGMMLYYGQQESKLYVFWNEGTPANTAYVVIPKITGAMHSVIATCDGITMSFYIDGIATQAITNPSAVAKSAFFGATANYPWAFGRVNAVTGTTTDGINGLLKTGVIFNVGLTPMQIRALSAQMLRRIP